MTDRTKHIVLVVDDCADMRSLVVESLEDAGFRTMEACNGIDAYAATQQSDDITAIVTDVQMPGGSGIDLIKDLRRDGCQIPIIAVTGGSSTWVDAAQNVGANLTFLKPFLPDLIVKSVEKLIDAHSASSPNVTGP